MHNVIAFQKKKPSDVHDFIDYEKGWKFTEDDKEFLIKYYEDWIQGNIEELDGDFIEEPTEILNSLKENGVEASKVLIQGSSKELSGAVCDDIYQYYAECSDTLKLTVLVMITLEHGGISRKNCFTDTA